MTDDRSLFTRRDFLRGSVGAAAAVSTLGLGMAAAKAGPPSLVTVVRQKNVQDAARRVNTKVLRQMVDQSLLMVTGRKSPKEAWLSLVGPKDVIGLVPTPHLNPTHGEVVEAVTASLQAAGIPAKNIVNAQGGPDKPKRCTALIGLPALKAHWLTGIGTVLKLYILYSGHPSAFHHADSTKLGEIWNLPFVKGKTRLILVDALYPLCDKGPQPDPRYQWKYNGLIAGTDPVAVETVCLKIINAKRRAIRGEPWPLSPPPICVAAADKVYHLGQSRLDRIKIETFGWKTGLLL